MKDCGKFLALLAVVTGLSLLYIRVQVSIFDVSYEIGAHARELSHQSETYRRLKFEVDQLKAPALLEKRMDELALDLTLPQELEVIRVPEPKHIEAHTLRKISIQPVSNSVVDFFGRWVKVAQAKPDH